MGFFYSLNKWLPWTSSVPDSSSEESSSEVSPEECLPKIKKVIKTACQTVSCKKSCDASPTWTKLLSNPQWQLVLGFVGLLLLVVLFSCVCKCKRKRKAAHKKRNLEAKR